VAYLGYGRHGTCHGRHFDGGRKNCLAKIKIFMYSFLNLYFAPHARGGTRLDGARDTKQVWSLASSCSNLRSFGNKCTVLKQVLVTLLFFSAPHAVISRPHGNSATGEFFPFSPLITPLPHAFLNCKAASTPGHYLKQCFSTFLTHGLFSDQYKPSRTQDKLRLREWYKH